MISIVLFLFYCWGLHCIFSISIWGDGKGQWSLKCLKGIWSQKNKHFFHLHFRPCTIIFSSFFLVYPSFFQVNKKKICFSPILGHHHCGSECRSQRSFLQLMTYDTRETCASALCRSIVTLICYRSFPLLAIMVYLLKSKDEIIKQREHWTWTFWSSLFSGFFLTAQAHPCKRNTTMTYLVQCNTTITKQSHDKTSPYF